MSKKTIELLNQAEINGRDHKIITNLKWNHIIILLIENDPTEDLKIPRGVGKVCILSPQFFFCTLNTLQKSHKVKTPVFG